MKPIDLVIAIAMIAFIVLGGGLIMYSTFELLQWSLK